VEILIKIAPQAYDRLRSHISTESAAHGAIETASRIDHAIEGVLFAGYLSLVMRNKHASFSK
jgi:hypothetical protein